MYHLTGTICSSIPCSLLWLKNKKSSSYLSWRLPLLLWCTWCSFPGPIWYWSLRSHVSLILPCLGILPSYSILSSLTWSSYVSNTVESSLSLLQKWVSFLSLLPSIFSLSISTSLRFDCNSFFSCSVHLSACVFHWVFALCFFHTLCAPFLGCCLCWWKNPLIMFSSAPTSLSLAFYISEVLASAWYWKSESKKFITCPLLVSAQMILEAKFPLTQIFSKLFFLPLAPPIYIWDFLSSTIFILFLLIHYVFDILGCVLFFVVS